MKIVSIQSGRINGNTQRTVELMEKLLLESAAKENIRLEIERISLCREKLEFCRGCRVCFDKGENFCPDQDGLLKIQSRVSGADGLILASPVYVEDVNGLMKNWIDRMAFNCHRPAFYGKCATVMTTSGPGSSNHSLNTMKNALSTWGVEIIQTHKYAMGARMEDRQIESQYGMDIRKSAIHLFAAVKTGSARRPSLFSLVAFDIKKKFYSGEKVRETDRLHWQNKGWLEPDCAYYMPIRCCDFKVWAASVLGKVLAKFFI